MRWTAKVLIELVETFLIPGSKSVLQLCLLIKTNGNNHKQSRAKAPAFSVSMGPCRTWFQGAERFWGPKRIWGLLHLSALCRTPFWQPLAQNQHGRKSVRFKSGGCRAWIRLSCSARLRPWGSPQSEGSVSGITSGEVSWAFLSECTSYLVWSKAAQQSYCELCRTFILSFLPTYLGCTFYNCI